MPKLDFEVITLGHGSGGLLTNTLLESFVLDLFSNEQLDRQHDGALFYADGQLAFSTDSFVVSPIFFPGGNIGELAVNGTVNDLAMCGAIPQYLSLSFIIEEGLKMKAFWDILVSIKSAVERANVKVITGDTKVVEKGKGDKLFINTTGVGYVHPHANIGVEQIKIHDKIIVTGPLARHGISVLSERQGLSFETTVVSDTCNLNEPVIRLLDDYGLGIHMLRDATRGGLATTLAEISKKSGLGIVVRETDIPIDEETSAACELMGLDPLYVANEGVFVAIVSAEVAEACVKSLGVFDNTKKARIIGEVVDEHPGKVICQSTIGGKRVLNLLPGEQLPRIC